MANVRSARIWPNDKRGVDVPNNTMQWTGERVLPMNQQHDVRDLAAHSSRYIWAMRFCVHKNVLDVACGEGYGTWILSWAADYASGVDINKEAVEWANQCYRGMPGSRVKYFVMDAENLYWSPESVDVIVSFETIEHLVHPEALVRSVYKLLKPGGLFICSAPWNSGSVFHVKDYTKEDLQALVSTQFSTMEYFVQDVGREMEIRQGETPTSEHPTHIFVCRK